ncbi:hypothetical protein AJ80_03515 [Polytolypa hystricis UAMH7299]|uniref:DUF1446 domain-containing protein n=1 Tax=Polytolypa hystricis (strain UAMH7299) TaxID=1447883 RepID=A0A2B7YHJ0_POLH7|nr:hypothetical protein AJ80_03515 [Polytolypa hystricis UAMH7299]
MEDPQSPKRAVRIAGASGGFTDRVRAIASMAQDPTVDAIVGDWLSENVMTGYGAGKVKALTVKGGSEGSDEDSRPLEERMKTAQYANTFLQCFEPAIPHLAKNGMKLVVNAGASDTKLLAEVCVKMVTDAGHDLKVAWVEGDDVTDTFQKMISQGEKFPNSITKKDLADWGFEPISAQCYLGSFGIAEALKHGADIVICGRVSDAGPTIGISAWWHNWGPEDYNELAGALIAGHLIECSAFITGGYYSRFKDLMKQKKHLNIGFPIVEVDHRGECTIVKEKNTGGCVNTETVISQLLYEISGPLYFNSDVVAQLTDIQVAQTGEDKVHVSCVTGLPPPPTTRLGVTAHGGYQAEFHFYLAGLDIEEKCQWMEEQVRFALGEDLINKFSLLDFQLHGTSTLNAPSLQLATVDFRIFAQAQDPKLFDPSLPDGFNRRILETVLQSCPGVSRSNDLRQTTAKPYFEYWVTLIPQSVLTHRVHFLFPTTTHHKAAISIPNPRTTTIYPPSQDSYETLHPVPSLTSTFGPTSLAPLGHIVLGRSGDKASNCNVGFFVRHADEYAWLCTFLTIDKIRELLAEDYKPGTKIDRFEMAGLKAVHFLLHDHLDRGYNACSKYDTLGKNDCEYLRAKVVEIPKRFLERGRV